MIVVTREVRTRATPRAVFAYLSDFTTTTAWDPGTVRTVRRSGDGGVGTVYDNTSSFNGRTTELTYTVTDHEAPRRITLRGENRTLEALDTITVEPDDHGSLVRYQATFRFRSPLLRFAAPFLRPAFRRLGDEAEAGMRAALAKL
jgi:carbon monoxide dehydrogenase subunit G